MSATPKPYSLWQHENDEYPIPHEKDRRLVGANYICVGILFGMIPETEQAQEEILRAVNAHDALVAALERFLTEYVEMVDSGDCGFWDPEAEPKVKAARAALAAARGEPS